MFNIAKNAVCWTLCGSPKFERVAFSGEGNCNWAIDEFGRAWGWGGNYGGGNLGIGPVNHNTHPEDYYVIQPRLLTLEDGTIKTDWLKFMQGENGSFCLDKLGRMWGAGFGVNGSPLGGHNCAAFGLPNDSGEDSSVWYGNPVRENYQYAFPYFTRAAPDYLAKDAMYNAYFTLFVGEDDYVYFMGGYAWNLVAGYQGHTTDDFSIPVLVDGLNAKVKKLFHNGSFNDDQAGCITVDNRLIVWGYGVDWWTEQFDEWDEHTNNFIDVTAGLPDEEIVFLTLSDYKRFVTLANGDVYGMGYNYDIGRAWDEDDEFYQWVKIDALKNMQWVRCTQPCNYGVDKEGQLWIWGSGDYMTGEPNPPGWSYEPQIAARKYRFKDLYGSYYNGNWNCIDQYGRLMAWGSQSWAPHLGNGTARQSHAVALGLSSDYWISESEFPQQCLYDHTLKELWINQRPFHAAVPRKYER